MADKLGADTDAVAMKTSTVTDDITTTMATDPPTTVVATESLDLEAPSVATKHNPTIIEDPPVIESQESNPTKVDDPQITTKSTSKPATIEDLPNELLSHILGFLDIPRPSADLHDEPTFELTDAETADLKASSCVSKRWRQAILPLLFKHARFVVGEPQPKMPIRNLNREIQSFMEFVNRNTLLKIITTFVLVVKDMTITGDDNGPKYKLDIFASFWRSLFEAIDPVELLIIAYPTVLGALTSCRVNVGELWNFDCPCHYLRLRRPSPLPSQLAVSNKAIDLSKYRPVSEAHNIVEPDTSIKDPIKNIPEDLLKRESAATTLNDSLESSDGQTANEPASAFSDIKEVLDAGHDSWEAELEPWQTYPQSSTLFKIRPWSSILLNEGSFIKVYSTYEFWNRKAPSVRILGRSALHVLTSLRSYLTWLELQNYLPVLSSRSSVQQSERCHTLAYSQWHLTSVP